MANGKDLYEENKRLRLEIDRLIEQRSEERERERDETEALSKLFLASAKAFLEGTAHLLIEDAGDGSRRVHFRL